jgi:hypothetical protein
VKRMPNSMRRSSISRSVSSSAGKAKPLSRVANRNRLTPSRHVFPAQRCPDGSRRIAGDAEDADLGQFCNCGDRRVGRWCRSDAKIGCYAGRSPRRIRTTASSSPPSRPAPSRHANARRWFAIRSRANGSSPCNSGRSASPSFGARGSWFGLRLNFIIFLFGLSRRNVKA